MEEGRGYLFIQIKGEKSCEGASPFRWKLGQESVYSSVDFGKEEGEEEDRIVCSR